MKTLKCGCIESYNLCPEAKKIYFPPRALGENHGAEWRKQRLAMWKKIHEHYEDNK